jgi:dipeptidyl aminopeptidase/acylaminoacyl peptidase
MADFRDLVGWLTERGHTKIGVMGMSLGGYSSALAATLEPNLRFAVPIIPLASIAEAARLHGHLGKTAEHEEQQYRALDAVHRHVSPLHRSPLLSPESMLVIGAEHDRITPVSQARRLAKAFGCRLETIEGGHLMQIGRADGFRSIGRMLNRLGVVNRDAAYGFQVQ